MSTIAGLLNATTAPGGGTSQASTTSGTDGLGKDAFLKLLIAQLRNQDPMKPMEDREFIAQLAQFSSLESLQNLEKRIDSMLVSQAIDQAAGLIGRQVEAEIEGLDGSTQLISGAVSEVRVVNGVPKLLVGDKELYLGQVTRVVA